MGYMGLSMRKMLAGRAFMLFLENFHLANQLTSLGSKYKIMRIMDQWWLVKAFNLIRIPRMVVKRNRSTQDSHGSTAFRILFWGGALLTFLASSNSVHGI